MYHLPIFATFSHGGIYNGELCYKYDFRIEADLEFEIKGSIFFNVFLGDILWNSKAWSL